MAHLLWGEEAVSKYIAKTGKFSDKDVEDRLNLEIKNKREFNVQYWPVFDRKTNEFIGCCGLRPYSQDKNIYEIGFHLRNKYWGMGISCEAAKAVIKYAFENLKAKEIFAGHNPNNVNSRKVLEKLGFQYIGDEFYEPTGLCHPSYKYVNSQL